MWLNLSDEFGISCNDHPLSNSEGGFNGCFDENLKKGTGDVHKPMTEEYKYPEEQFAGKEDEDQGELHSEPQMESSDREGSEATSSPRKGLEHSISEPVPAHRNLVVDEKDNITFYRSITEHRSKHELKFHRFFDQEKNKLLIELVRVQHDGTVAVDLDKNDSVTSELLELHSVGSASFIMNEDTSEVNKPIPKLNIAILVVGTRGDVQPFLAMAKRLQEFGHRVRLATHVNFRSFVKAAGVGFYPLGGDPRVLAGYMARNKGLIPSSPGEISIQRKQMKDIIESLLPACTEPDPESGVSFKAQAIIANPPAYGHVHVAEALGVPIHIFFTMPWTPTYEFPHPLARVPQSAGYWLSYILVDLLIWWGIRGYINDFRKKLKLQPIAYYSMYHGSISHLPTGYLWSPSLVSKPMDWGPQVDVVGYCFLNLASKYEPRREFTEWIKKGTKPIYIGFGSMPLEDPQKTMEIILEALKETEQRGIIDQGWGGLGSLVEAPDYVFLLEDCPHDWLFPQCAAVVHHGGAGTTATGLRAGCPTTIVPFFGDQFFWGDRLFNKGLGPQPIPISQLTVENLSSAIQFMLQAEVKAQATELAKLIDNEDGVAGAVNAFHRQLPHTIPLPATSSSSSSDSDDELSNGLQWLFAKIGRICCLPCTP
ncbi:Sterol 3-beta-glucosyltransferase UGT80B1 [Linum perenne]